MTAPWPLEPMGSSGPASRPGQPHGANREPGAGGPLGHDAGLAALRAAVPPLSLWVLSERARMASPRGCSGDHLREPSQRSSEPAPRRVGGGGAARFSSPPASDPWEPLTGQHQASLSRGLKSSAGRGQPCPPRGDVGTLGPRGEGLQWTLEAKQGLEREKPLLQRPIPEAQHHAPQATTPHISGEPLCPPESSPGLSFPQDTSSQ